MLTPELGNRLAALVDGEGCFYVGQSNRHKPTPTYACMFVVKMRDDDEPFLRLMAEKVGVGTIMHERQTRADGHRRAPAVRWAVHSKSDCLALVAIFDRFPLWSKRARDYGIWREAVLYWNSVGGPLARDTDWSPMRRFADELRLVRAYAPA